MTSDSHWEALESAEPPRQGSARFETEALPQLDFLYRFAVRLTGDAMAAEDLVQETMLKAFRAWHQYRPGSNVKAWLATILRNTFINERRRRKRSVSGMDDDILERLASARVPDASNPERDFFDGLIDDEIVHAIDALPDEFREALVLSDVEDLPYTEIARIVDAPLGTVKSRIFRGRQILQRELRAYAEEMGYLAAPVGPS